MPTPIPTDEEENARLAVLRQISNEIETKSAKREFEALVTLFAQAMGCPMGVLSLAEQDHFLFPTRLNFDISALLRQDTVCNVVLQGDEPVMVEDLQADPRFSGLSLVRLPPGLRFYAGVPLVMEGWRLGVLCALHHEPRRAAPQDHETMRRFARVAQALLHNQVQQARLRRNGQQLHRQNRLFQQSEEMARLGGWEIDLGSGALHWSDGVFRIHELPPGEPSALRDALQYYPEPDRARLQLLLDRLVALGEPFDFEGDFITAQGHPRRVRALGQADLEQGRPVRITGIFQDITESWQMTRRLRQLALSDSLTGLGNRAALFEQLEALPGTLPGGEAALLVLDLDGFQDLNDRHGHAEGDRVLRGVAQRLSRVAGKAGFVARTGSDEFALLLPQPGPDEELREKAQRMAASLQVRLPEENRWRPLSASIGVALWPRDADGPASLLRQADMALSHGRRQGKARITLFSPAIATQFRQRRLAIDHVQKALAEDRLRPFYQPKIRLSDGHLVGFEALMRVLEPDGTISGPAQFWPALQEPGTAELIGIRMLGAITRDLSDWRHEGLPPTRIGLNVAEADFLDDGLAERVMERLRTCELPPGALEIEVTETVFLGPQRPTVTQTLQRLHDAGLRIALDDFGTGYASLVHLRDFPIHALKIDKSFIDGVEQEGGSRLIVETLIRLAHGLGLEVVAEGVESGTQHRLLRDLGCDIGQGHHYGMALPAETVRRLLRPPA